MFKGKHKLFTPLDFHESTLLHRQAASVFETLINTLTGECIQFGEQENTPVQEELDIPLLLRSMPGYWKAKYRGDRLRVKTVKTFPGSLIDLKTYPGYEDYLTKRFNGKQRAQFRSSKALLEHCFEIEHKVYFGAIEEQEYHRLFVALKDLHLARLALKGSPDDTEGMWAMYQASAFRQILAREACLSVIYHGDSPIAISLNFILGKVVHGFNRSFDMAYSKFGLGTIELLNMVEWCFEQGFETLDFMKGEYNYKNRFTDTHYGFTIQLIYGQGLGQKLKGLSLYYGLEAFYALFRVAKSVGLHRLWHKLSKGTYKISAPNKIARVRTLDPERSHTMGERHMIEWGSIQDATNRKAICDFCHKHKKALKNISLFSFSETPSTLLLMEGSQMLSIIENENQNSQISKP